MPTKFQTGDIVRLKTGGQDMVVEQAMDVLPELVVRCVWFSGGPRLQKAYLRAGALELADPPP